MVNKVKIALILVSSVVGISVNAQGSNNTEKLEQKKDNIEQIEVVGQRPAYYYRTLTFKTQDEFFDMYNNLTDNEDFKMSCRRMKLSLSRIRKRLCVPGYQTNASLRKKSPALAAIKRRQAGGDFAPELTRAEINMKKKAQLEDIKAKLAASPELAEKYVKWNESELEYKRRLSLEKL